MSFVLCVFLFEVYNYDKKDKRNANIEMESLWQESRGERTERAVRTTLLEGKVRVSVPSSGNKGYLLEPGMQLEYTPSERSVSVRSVDAGRVLDWAEGYLSFRGASFPEIAQALERRFDVSVSYNSDRIPVSLLNVRFTPDDTLEDALGVLTLLLPGSRYKLEGNRVYMQFM